MKKSKIIRFIICVLGPLICGIIVGFLIDAKAYNGFTKPPLSPPAVLFPIVWTIIYLIFYFTMVKYYDNSKIYNLYIVILIIQTLWNMVFFGLGSFLLALLIIIVLYFISWLFVYYLSKENKKYLYIYLIYIIWLLIATYLNIGIYILN